MLKKVKRVGISLDMTPLVDIAFLMLIFFMATTVFKPPEKDQINLPESRSDLKAPEGKVITIVVNSGSEVSMEYRAQGKRFSPDIVGPEDLRGHLQAARMADPGARILVKADENASYGAMQDVMDLLQDENAGRFNIVTDLEQGAGALARGR